jgi:hypothetical protein
MPDPIALRVLARFRRQAISDPKALLDNVEDGMHRGKEMLHAVVQAHNFLEKAVVESAPFAHVVEAHRKIHPLIAAYEREVQGAMAGLDDYEHIRDAEERAYDTGHRMAGNRGV